MSCLAIYPYLCAPSSHPTSLSYPQLSSPLLPTRLASYSTTPAELPVTHQTCQQHRQPERTPGNFAEQSQRASNPERPPPGHSPFTPKKLTLPALSPLLPTRLASHSATPAKLPVTHQTCPQHRQPERTPGNFAEQSQRASKPARPPFLDDDVVVQGSSTPHR